MWAKYAFYDPIDNIPGICWHIDQMASSIDITS